MIRNCFGFFSPARELLDLNYLIPKLGIICPFVVIAPTYLGATMVATQALYL